MARELILSCFHARTVAHLLHLTTRSYAAHKALNEFYDEIIDLVDSFAEAYQGEYGLIDFGGDEQPRFTDFFYLAFTIGMTYQVSDTTFTSSRFRRVAIRHALLSFVFGTAIIATSINFLASLTS